MTLSAWESVLMRTVYRGKVLVYGGSETGGCAAACTSVAHFLAVCTSCFCILFLNKVEKARRI